MSHCETFSLHPSLAGLVIGRGGCNFKTVSDKSGSRLFYNKQTQLVTIKGKTFSSCDKAKTLLTKLVKAIKTRQAQYQRSREIPTRTDRRTTERAHSHHPRHANAPPSQQVPNEGLNHLLRFNCNGNIRERKHTRYQMKRFDDQIQTLYNAHKLSAEKRGKWPLGFWIFRERTLAKLLAEESAQDTVHVQEKMTSETAEWLATNTTNPVECGVWGNVTRLANVMDNIPTPQETSCDDTPQLFSLTTTTLEALRNDKTPKSRHTGFLRRKTVSQASFFDDRELDEYELFDSDDFDLGEYSDTEYDGYEIGPNDVDDTVWC